MKLKYYRKVYENPEGEPIVCVSTVRDEKSGFMARGVSVCSKDDKPDWDKGLELADRLALRAMKRRERIRPIIDKRALSQLLQTECPFTFHIEYEPELTMQELHYFFKKDLEKRLERRFQRISKEHEAKSMVDDFYTLHSYGRKA